MFPRHYPLDRPFAVLPAAALKWLLIATLFSVVSCQSEPAMVLTQQTVTVGCGRCIFDMQDVEGCPWAAEIDGKHYLMSGALPDHDSHDSDGICNMQREAIVDGEIRGEELVVSKMLLTPAEGIPDTPRFAPGEGH
jgi:hypothetical protein